MLLPSRVSLVARIFIGLFALLLTPSALAVETVTESGYLPARDGTLLRWSVIRPVGDGPFPVMMQFSGYASGSNPYDNGMDDLGPRFVEQGYAVAGVNVRGTGCSEGALDIFAPVWKDDGYDAVEFMAARPWASGNVGLFGISLPGILAQLTAASQPPSLRAILPFSSLTDLYRDVTWPGGMFNQSFVSLFTVVQPAALLLDGPQELADGDPVCEVNYAQHSNPDNLIIRQGQERPYADDAFYTRFAPDADLRAIKVPALYMFSWQDEQLAARLLNAMELLDPNKTWVIAGSGSHVHGVRSEFVKLQALEFADYYVKGASNSFPETPHVQFVHESNYRFEPNWVTSHAFLPVPTAVTTLYLRADGQLAAEPFAEAGSLSFPYPRAAPSMSTTGTAATANGSWQTPVAPGGSVTFTTPPLAQDLEVLGPARLELWLSSSSSDADVQVTITNVRADGQEWFVQRGWLRASHRKLDPVLSRVTQPVSTYLQKDEQPLVPGEPTLMSVEVWPFGHVFRAGSSLRLTIESPLSVTGLRALQIAQTSATHTVHLGPEHSSRLLLPVVPGGKAQGDYQVCGDTSNQPCRNNPTPLPAGELQLTGIGADAIPLGGVAELVRFSSPELTGTKRQEIGRFRLKNQTADAQLLHSVDIEIDEADEIAELVLIHGRQSFVVERPLKRSRIALPLPISLAAGATENFEVQLRSSARPVAFQLGWLTQAHAAAMAAPFAEHSKLPVALLLLLLVAVLLPSAGRQQRRLVAIAVLTLCWIAGCGDSKAPDAGNLVNQNPVHSASSVRLVNVDVRSSDARFFRYQGLALGLGNPSFP